MTLERRSLFRMSRSLASRASMRWIALAFAGVLLAGCVSNHGYGGDGYSDYGSQRVLGTVQDVDPHYGRIVLTADDRYRDRTSRVVLRFDRNTRLFYQGRQQAVAGLERGDRVSVDTVRSGGESWARRIEVVHNVRDSHGGGYYGGELSGAVTFVDPRAQVIGLTRGGYSGRREQVRYDNRTMVEYRGQRVRPEQLESGDVVSIQARPWGNDWLAERIWVERSVRER